MEHVFKKHDEKMKQLVAIFREVDTDEDGIIDQESLITMMEKIEQKKSIGPEQVLEWVDPQETNVITFSHLAERMLKNEVLREFFNE